MKRCIAGLITFSLLIFCVTGCTFRESVPKDTMESTLGEIAVPSLDGTVSSTLVETEHSTLEKMEVFQALNQGIQEESSLQEMLDAFVQMCHVPMETSCNVYIFDISVYEYEGQWFADCLITRQFETPAYHEMLDCGLSVTYLLDTENTDLQDSIFIEEDLAQFIHYVTNSFAFQELTKMPIFERYIGIDCW